MHDELIHVTLQSTTAALVRSIVVKLCGLCNLILHKKNIFDKKYTFSWAEKTFKVEILINKEKLHAKNVLWSAMHIFFSPTQNQEHESTQGFFIISLAAAANENI